MHNALRSWDGRGSIIAPIVTLQRMIQIPISPSQSLRLVVVTVPTASMKARTVFVKTLTVSISVSTARAGDATDVVADIWCGWRSEGCFLFEQCGQLGGSDSHGFDFFLKCSFLKNSGMCN